MLWQIQLAMKDNLSVALEGLNKEIVPIFVTHKT